MDKPLAAGPALDLILAGTETAHPPVFGVTSDCQDMREGGTGFGFFLDGGCRGGLTVAQGVFIVLHPDGGRYSMNLAHEVAGHWAAGGDFDPDHKSFRFSAGGPVDLAKAALV